MSNGEAQHRISAEAICAGLGTKRIGRKVIVFDEIDSTNQYVLTELALREGAAADGWVVLAEYQSAGRGRLGRQWLSPRGAGLSMTVLLCEPDMRLLPARLMMAAAVGVAEGIAKCADVEPLIRWPNDVYIGQKKVAGVLVEVRSLPRGGFAIALGIGVNCLQQAGHFAPELRDKATSLEIETSQPVDRASVARAILGRLDELLCEAEAIEDTNLAQFWRILSGDMGQQVTLVSNGETFSGRIMDVHPQNGLLLALDEGGRRSFDPSTTSRI